MLSGAPHCSLARAKFTMPRLQYTLARTFPSLEEAVEFVSAHYTYLMKKGTRRTSCGRRSAFVCRSNDCSCRAEVCEEEGFVEFRTHGEHDTAIQLPDRVSPFNKAVREVIEPLAGKGLPPAAMNRALRRHGLAQLTSQQLSQFSLRYRRKVNRAREPSSSISSVASAPQKRRGRPRQVQG